MFAERIRTYPNLADLKFSRGLVLKFRIVRLCVWAKVIAV